MSSADLSQDTAVKSLAYELADNLRSKYISLNQKVPTAETQQALQQLQHQFDLTVLKNLPKSA